MNADPVRGRAFVAADTLTEGATLTLDAAESHYLVRVRRAGAGAAVQLLDGVDTKHAATVVRADAHGCVVLVGARVHTPPPPTWVVFVGIVDAQAVAETIAGASEAGAAAVVFVRTARAQAALPALSRMDKVRRAAQRQCGRAAALQIEGPLAWPDALGHRRELPAWVATPDAAPSPTPAASGGGRVLIGPEGGLTPQELARAVAEGFSALSLGPYVQRTPTAVVSALGRLCAG